MIKKLLILYITVLFFGSLALISTEARGQLKLKKKSETEEVSEDSDESEYEHTFKYFIESENFISTYTEQDFEDIFKKNEIRNNLQYQFGSDTLFFKLDMNLYATPHLFSDDINSEYLYSSDFKISRNLTISDEAYELNFHELYFNYEIGKFRFRIGNQVFAWGTSDVFSPTSYFNPLDFREALFKDDDEIKQPVPSVSTMMFIGDDSLELIIVPFHVPMIFAPNGNFWGVEYSEGFMPIIAFESKNMDIAWQNVGAGLQYSTKLAGADLYLSMYHGPDREPVLRPVRTILNPFAIKVIPETFVVDMFGLAVSKGFDKITLQGEVAYSPDKKGVIEQDYSNPLLMDWPFKVRTYHFLSYTVGFNYFIPLDDWIEGHQGDSVFTVEWSRPVIFDEEIMKPMIEDLLIVRLEDTFFDSHLKIEMSGIIDIANIGYILMPRIEYKFNMGISLSLWYSYINAKNESFVDIFTNNDYINFRVRYEYE